MIDNRYVTRLELLLALKKYAITIRPEGEEITLASGSKSRIYCDVRKVMLSRRHLRFLAHELYCILLEDVAPTVCLAGVPSAGIHLASIVAMYAQPCYDVVLVRPTSKTHGTGKRIETPANMLDNSVVLFEDVVTTGASSISAIEALKAEGFSVRGVIAVVDRRSFESIEHPGYIDSNERIPLKALFRINELIDDVSLHIL